MGQEAKPIRHQRSALSQQRVVPVWIGDAISRLSSKRTTTFTSTTKPPPYPSPSRRLRQPPRPPPRSPQ